MSSDQNILHAILKEFQELKKEIRFGFKKVDARFEQMENKIDNLDVKLTKRLDKIGSQVAYLEDDAPTRMEFNQLDKRITKIEENTPLKI